jgi:aerobic carbon-monoxide dehydrogenase medium subunit
MKPAPFSYHSPATIDEAVTLLAELGPDAKVLAGGQSLVPLMNLRLARPSAIVDVRRVEDAATITANGALRLGCMVRYTQAQGDAQVAAGAPLLADAIRYVGHSAIRNRGTVGGSLAHADPAAEAPLVAVALDAELVVASTRGRRSIPAAEFFQGPFMTALEDDELLVESAFPVAAASDGWGFREVARCHGDFALVAVAVVARLDGDTYDDVRVAVGGASDRPLRIAQAEAALTGARVDDADAREAAGRAVREAVSPSSDAHASAAYRKDVAGTLATRAIEDATRRARGVDEEGK